MVQALEAIGAAVESERPGEAFFALDGLRGLHGGSSAGVLAAARRALGEEKAIATGSTRFAAFLAAGGWSRPVPVAALRTRLGRSEREATELIEALERLGIETLEAFAAPHRRSGRRPLRTARPGGAAALPRGGGAAATAGSRTRSSPRRSSCRKEPRDGSSTAPSSCSSTACSRRRGGRGGPCSASASGRASPPAAAGASSRDWAGRAPRRGSCATCSSRGSRTCRARRRAAAAGGGPRPSGARPARARGRRAASRGGAGSAPRCARCGRSQGAEALLKILPVDAASRVPERWAMLTPYPEL